MRVAATIAVCSALIFLASYIIDGARPDYEDTPTWFAAAGLSSFVIAALASTATLICLIWGVQ